jgi:type II secretory pathway pseudopilin PulG
MSPRRHRRGGWALIELLVVFSVLAVLMTIAAGLVFQMLRIGGSERSRVVVAADLERLARDLRGDGREAAAPDLRPDRLILSLPGGRAVEYGIARRDVLRTVRRAGKIEHREIYRLPLATTGGFELSREGSRPVIALVLATAADAKPDRPPDPGYRDFRIEAVPGRAGPGGAR